MTKTYKVEDLRNRVNNMIEAMPAHDNCGRQALYTLLEAVLMGTNNYNGFKYLDIEFDPTNNEVLTYGDETRRYYF